MVKKILNINALRISTAFHEFVSVCDTLYSMRVCDSIYLYILGNVYLIMLSATRKIGPGSHLGGLGRRSKILLIINKLLFEQRQEHSWNGLSSRSLHLSWLRRVAREILLLMGDSLKGLKLESWKCSLFIIYSRKFKPLEDNHMKGSRWSH